MKLKNLDNIVTLFDKDNDENATLGTEKSGKCLMIPTSSSQPNSPVRKQIGRCISPIKVVSVPNDQYRVILIKNSFLFSRCLAAKKFRSEST